MELETVFRDEAMNVSAMNALEWLAMSTKTDNHFGGLTSESLLIAAGRDRRPGSPLNIPPVLASNFVLGTDRGYARDDSTPTWEALEEIVGVLEEGDSVAFASGMAGIAAVFDQLQAGSRVVLPDDCYQGVAGLAESGRQKGLWSVSRLAVKSHEVVPF
jgi:cystathionine gamma-synthase